MSKHTNTEFDEIKSRIKDMRSAMNVSGSVFSLIYSADHFRLMFILSGIFSVLFPLLYEALLLIYGSAQLIPQWAMIVFYILLFLCWCVLVAVRTRASIRAAREMGIQSSAWAVVRQILSTRMWLAVVPVLLMLIALPIKYADAFDSLAYVPYFGVALGLVLNMIGVMIREKEYSVCGAWMILSGAAGFFALSIPVHIAFAVVLAPACFIFVIVNGISHKHREQQDESV